MTPNDKRLERIVRVAFDRLELKPRTLEDANLREIRPVPASSLDNLIMGFGAMVVSLCTLAFGYFLRDLCSGFLPSVALVSFGQLCIGARFIDKARREISPSEKNASPGTWLGFR